MRSFFSCLQLTYQFQMGPSTAAAGPEAAVERPMLEPERPSHPFRRHDGQMSKPLRTLIKALDRLSPGTVVS